MVLTSKRDALDAAIEIAKEYARSGNSASVDHVLESVYEMLKKLRDDSFKD